jgi:hypothetical protein
MRAAYATKTHKYFTSGVHGAYKGKVMTPAAATHGTVQFIAGMRGGDRNDLQAAALSLPARHARSAGRINPRRR